MNITRKTYRVWTVEDEEGRDFIVRYTEKGWKCSCKPIQKSHCDHILEVMSYLMREKICHN